MAKERTTEKKKPPIVLVLVILLLFIPIVILGAVLLSSLEDSSKPVVGSRFEQELDPQITEENVKSLEEALKFEGVDQVEVNFKSARVAILIDTKDDASAKQIKKFVNDAYSKVDEILPIKTYFTNKVEGDQHIKMYDLQIDAYNYIEGDKPIHYVGNKTGAQEKFAIQNVTSPKNKEVSKEVLSQKDEEETEKGE